MSSHRRDRPEEIERGRAPRGPGSRLLARINPEAVGLRELPFTVIFLFVAAVLATHPGTEHLWALLAGAVLVVAIQLIASLGRWDHWSRAWQYALPLAQMLCLIALDYASSENPSFFTVMLFLPVVSLALQPGTVGVALGTVATAAITFGAAVLPAGPPAEGPVALLRVFVVTVCALLVSAGVYAVTQRLRDRTEDLLALQAEQQTTLQTVERQRDRLTDLTDRLESSRDLFRSTVEAATELVVVATDQGGLVLVASPGTERVLGRAPHDLVGTPVTDLVDHLELRRFARTRVVDGEPPSDLQALVGSASEGEPEQREWTFTREDGTGVPVNLVVTRRRRLEESGADGYLFVAADLTERRESERLQDEFIGLVSHELRTPLASILGYTELLRAGAETLPAEERGYVDVIDRNGQRLLRLVNDLLLSVQLVAGTFALTPDEVDAADVAWESVATLQPTAAASRVRVVFEPVGPAPLLTDPERLGQVVENLLANAVKFTPAGGTVRLQLSGSRVDGRRQIRLVVTDDGPGMTETEIARVTERFFRTETSRRQRVRGLGLGLSIVDAIVRAHGGSMTISSEPGSGTTITVLLPDLEAQAQTDANAVQ